MAYSTHLFSLVNPFVATANFLATPNPEYSTAEFDVKSPIATLHTGSQNERSACSIVFDIDTVV
jgi:hypothetical protein